MEKFNRQRFENIQAIFEKQTGTQVAGKEKAAHFGAGRTAAVLCMALCFVAMSAFAYARFSDLAGDEAGFSSVYMGDGVFEITITNFSDRELKLQEQIRLMRWSAGEEVEGNPAKIEFQNMKIAPHSEGTVRIDLSQGYDIAELEKPLESGDWYYLVLTNNYFAFGQDWMCDIIFDTDDSREAVFRETASTSEAGISSMDENNERDRYMVESEELDRTAYLKYEDWTWPTESGKVSSFFGVQKNGALSDHINIAGDTGDAVYAVADGIVAETGFDVIYGNYILMDMGNGISVKYGHLNEIRIKAGDQVSQGEEIGKLGATGMATGPNLSFAVFLNGEAVDPLAE